MDWLDASQRLQAALAPKLKRGFKRVIFSTSFPGLLPESRASARLLSQCTSDIGLPDAGRSGDGRILPFRDPPARSELANHRPVEVACSGVVDVLDAGVAELEFRLPQVAIQPSTLSISSTLRAPRRTARWGRLHRSWD